MQKHSLWQCTGFTCACGKNGHLQPFVPGIYFPPQRLYDLCKSRQFLIFIGFFVTREKFVKFSKSANLTEEVAIDNWGSRKAASALPWHGMAWHAPLTGHGMAGHSGRVLINERSPRYIEALIGNSPFRPQSQVFVQNCKDLLTYI